MPGRNTPFSTPLLTIRAVSGRARQCPPGATPQRMHELGIVSESDGPWAHMQFSNFRVKIHDMNSLVRITVSFCCAGLAFGQTNAPVKPGVLIWLKASDDFVHEGKTPPTSTSADGFVVMQPAPNGSLRIGQFMRLKTYSESSTDSPRDIARFPMMFRIVSVDGKADPNRLALKTEDGQLLTRQSGKLIIKASGDEAIKSSQIFGLASLTPNQMTAQRLRNARQLQTKAEEATALNAAGRNVKAAPGPENTNQRRSH
jgi:hypothetical protein